MADRENRRDRRISHYEREAKRSPAGDTPPEPAIPEGFLKSRKGSGYKKAAKLLLLLGREEASRIMSHLSEEELAAITSEIAEISRVDETESRKILREFGETTQEHRLGRGGPEVARKMLINTFGEERGREMMERILPAARHTPFEFLADIEAEQLIILLKNEPPSVLSTVLPYIDPAKAGAVLTSLDASAQKQTVTRIAKLNKIPPEVLAKIEEALRTRLRTQGKIVTEEIDGTSVLAGILKEMDYSAGEALLADLGDSDPVLSETVRKKVVSIDVVFSLSDQDLQTVLRDFDDGEIAVILKGKSDDLRERFLACVSARRRIIIAEEIVHLGSMRKSDVDRATGEFIDYIRNLERQNRIVIRRENDYFI